MFRREHEGRLLFFYPSPLFLCATDWTLNRTQRKAVVYKYSSVRVQKVSLAVSPPHLLEQLAHLQLVDLPGRDVVLELVPEESDLVLV